MKKVIKIISSLIFSLLIIGAFPIKSESISNKFNLIETQLMNTNDFVENGVRTEYIVNQSIYKEKILIEEKLKKTFGENVGINNDSIIYKDEFKEIEVVLWSDNENTKVQITYINNNKNINTLEIRKELKKIQNISAKNIKYFDFVRVKIIEDQKQHLLEVLRNNIKQNTLEILDIYNGSVAKGRLYDGNRISIGHIKYDTGEYLIIGTPVIFVTY